MPGTTKSYLVALSDLSLADRQAMRSDADENILSAAMQLAIRTSPDQLIIRDTLPSTDLNSVAAVVGGAAGTAEDWLLAAAGVVGTESVFIQNALAQDRVIGFYGVALESVPPPVSRLRFTLGATSSQVRGVFQLEQLNTRLESVGYFSEVVIFTRQETCRVLVMPRVAFAVNTQRIQLLARTIEPIGQTVSAPSI